MGAPLYCHARRGSMPRRPLAELASIGANDIASNTDNYAVRSLCFEADVLALAKRVSQAFPDNPVLGVDIVRDRKSGQLFVIEANASGSVWHLSSNFGQAFLSQELREQSYKQFDAIKTAAERLIEKTRSDAV